MNKRLLITSTDLMMVQFLIPHVKNLAQNGFDVEIACSDVGGRMDEVREKLKESVKAIHVVRLVRSPTSLMNLKGYGDMRRVIARGKYDIIWTNEPVMGVVTRLAARDVRKRGTKVIYMVHGFQFFDGAAKKDWLLYYPVERFVSRFCDEIVTINHEDYNRAQQKMHAPSVRYIHGIGVNTDRLHGTGNPVDIRRELRLPDGAFLLLSVGELLPRKNQQVIVRALGILKDPDAHYIVCGKGRQLEELQALAEANGVAGQVHFLGYRKDVQDIYGQVDVLVFPSRREGLGLAGLEGMYCGLPVVSSNTSGPRDYMENGKTGFMYDPDDAAGFAEGIRTLKEDPALRAACGAYNKTAMEPFRLERVLGEVEQLLREC